MSARKQEHISIHCTHPIYDAVRTGADLIGRLTSGAAIPKQFPVGPLGMDVSAGETFVLAVIPFEKIMIDLCDVAEVDHDLLEWDYGQYEGLTSADIHAKRPDWKLFRDGCPGGESPDQVGARADRVINRVRAVNGNVLLFSSGHFLRVLGARWIELEPSGGRYFLLSTASLSAVSYERNLSQPVVRLWDDTRHVGA